MAVGDFTNVRVESQTYDSATIRYTYAGAGSIALYRSTDGVSYASVQSIPAAYGSYPTLKDVTVSPETLYYYKFTDDAGGTFTSPVTVKIQKKFLAPLQESKTLALKSFDNEDAVNAANVDALRADVENYLNSDYAAPVRKDCTVCPTNGALVLDCVDGCFSFTVKQEDITDVNSISVHCVGPFELRLPYSRRHIDRDMRVGLGYRARGSSAFRLLSPALLPYQGVPLCQIPALSRMSRMLPHPAKATTSTSAIPKAASIASRVIAVRLPTAAIAQVSLRVFTTRTLMV